MKRIISLLVAIFFILFSSCSSDSDSFIKEERELRTLFNNEWEVVESGYSAIYPGDFVGYSLTKAESDTLLDIPMYAESSVIKTSVGMNKNGGFYL